MEKLDIKMNTKRSISLTKKRLRNRNNILRSKLRNDVDINNKDEENGFFLSRLNKTAKSYTKYHKIKKRKLFHVFLLKLKEILSGFLKKKQIQFQ